MNKKGQGLPFNVVIIGLIGVVVLLLVILIFFGGARWIKETLSSVGGERLKGTDITLAQQNCELYCDYAKDLSATAASKSAYCTTNYNLDMSPMDGEVDKDTDGKPTKYYCDKSKPKNLGMSCGSIVC